MRKMVLLCLVFLVFSSLVFAQTSEDKRRVEQEKRDFLKVSEEYIAPAKVKPPISKEAEKVDYFSELVTKEVVLREDALKAIIILLGLQEQYPDTISQQTFLISNNIIPNKYIKKFNPQEPLTKGLAAYMFCRAFKIKGGIVLRMVGMRQRYALQTLVHEGIMFPGYVNDRVSGKEFVLMIIQTADYLTRQVNIQEEFKGGEKQDFFGKIIESPEQKKRILFDYGAWLDFRYTNYTDGDNDSSTRDTLDDTYEADTRLWFKVTLKPPLEADYDNEHIFYFRLKDLSVKRFPEDTDDYGYDHEGPHIDYAYAVLDFRPWWVEAGRQYFNIGRGITYSNVNDGIRISYYHSDWNLKVFMSHTLPHEDNIDLSVPGYDKDSDRYYYGLEGSLTAFVDQIFYGYALGQRDFSNEDPESVDQQYVYNSEYFGIGAEGKLTEGVQYWAEFLKECGTSYTFGTNDKKSVDAWGTDVGVSYEKDVYSHPRVTFEYAFGSGDADRLSVTDTEDGNTAGDDENFLYFGYLSTGYALAPRLSNLHMYHIGASLKPLERYRPLRQISFDIDYYRYYKQHSSGGISDPEASENSKDIGQEIDLTLFWPVFSDLQWTLRYGHFFPGKAYPETTNDPENYFSSSLTVVF